MYYQVVYLQAINGGGGVGVAWSPPFWISWFHYKKNHSAIVESWVLYKVITPSTYVRWRAVATLHQQFFKNDSLVDTVSYRIWHDSPRCWLLLLTGYEKVVGGILMFGIFSSHFSDLFISKRIKYTYKLSSNLKGFLSAYVFELFSPN